MFPERLSAASYQDLKDQLDLVLRRAKRRAQNLETLTGKPDDEAAN